MSSHPPTPPPASQSGFFFEPSPESHGDSDGATSRSGTRTWLVRGAVVGGLLLAALGAFVALNGLNRAPDNPDGASGPTTGLDGTPERTSATGSAGDGGDTATTAGDGVSGSPDSAGAPDGGDAREGADGADGGSFGLADGAEAPVRPDETALWPADNADVQALLEAIRYGDAADLLDQLDWWHDARLDEAWHVFASALAAADDPKARATLLDLLAGRDPASRWLVEEPAFAAATGRLTARLLAENPQWLRHADGRDGFEGRVARSLLRLAEPLVGVTDARGLRDLFAAVQEADNPDVEMALLDYMSRSSAVLRADDGDVETLRDLVGRLANHQDVAAVRANTDRHVAALRALAELDETAGTRAILGSLSREQGAQAAVRAVAELARHGRWSPERPMSAELLDALAAASVPDGTQGSPRWDLAAESMQAWSALAALPGGALPEAARAHVIERLARAVFQPAAAVLADNTSRYAHALWEEQALGLLLTERLGDDRLYRRIAQMTDGTDATRAEAGIRLLGRMNSDQATDRLHEIGANSAASVRVRLAALQTLAAPAGAGNDVEYESAPPLAPQTQTLLTNLADGSSGADVRIRARAARLLGERAGHDDQVAGRLQTLARQDPDPTVRAAAIHGLAASVSSARRADLAAWLAERARDDTSPYVRNAAQRARATLGVSR